MTKTPPPSQNSSASTETLTAAYPDLEEGRFHVLADFERPEQGTLFRITPDYGNGSTSVSADRPRTNTGVGSLKMPFYDSKQRVIASNSASSSWGLHSDWSDYHLLSISVYSPRLLGGFRLRVTSGLESPLDYDQPRFLLQQGWNLLHIDLDEIANHIDLGDVRQLAFWCDPLDTPTDLYLDDLILVDNTKYLFGEKDGPPGELYVLHKGRRLVVGASGRFELAFAHGRIREWYDLTTDANSAHNLAGIGPIGPVMVALPSESGSDILLDDASQWSGLGISAEVQQAISDMTPMYAVIQGEWRFGSLDAPTTEANPYHRWVYTVYQDGRVYIECSGTARSETFTPERLGIAFCCDSTMGFERLLHTRENANSPAVEYALFHRQQSDAADLLVAPFVAQQSLTLNSAEDPRRCVLWPLPATEVFAFAAMLRVWPTDIDTSRQAQAMAYDYAHPFPIDMNVGQLVRTDSGDFDNDGFSEARGYYVLQLMGNTSRLVIDGRQRVRFGPLFKVVDVADRDVWVYLDGRLIKNTQRDNDQNVVFRIPDVSGRSALLEINARVRESMEPETTE